MPKEGDYEGRRMNHSMEELQDICEVIRTLEQLKHNKYAYKMKLKIYEELGLQFMDGSKHCGQC